MEPGFQRQISGQAERKLPIDRDVDAVRVIALGCDGGDSHEWIVDGG
jgi:hypothetical protein